MSGAGGPVSGLDGADELAPAGGALIHLAVFVHDPAPHQGGVHGAAQLPALEHLHDVPGMAVAVAEMVPFWG